MTRLDKILSTQLNITRSQAKSVIRQGRVQINSVTVKSADVKCNESDIVSIDGRDIVYNRFVYIMMNKPKGVISASQGRGELTVIDLLPDSMKRSGLFPAGRLDKNTTGFVLITDDGEFAHNILSPSRHISKTYIATLDKSFDDTLVEDFRKGMVLSGKKLLKADIEALNDEKTVAKVVLRQGLYHQVKRMFGKYGISVVELERIKMGNLPLDSSLGQGECRYITSDELKKIL